MTQSKLEDKKIEILELFCLAGWEIDCDVQTRYKLDNIVKELAAYVREETLREVAQEIPMTDEQLQQIANIMSLCNHKL